MPVDMQFQLRANTNTILIEFRLGLLQASGFVFLGLLPAAVNSTSVPLWLKFEARAAAYGKPDYKYKEIHHPRGSSSPI